MSEATGTRWTRAQERAISLRGCNILVSAAAGAGKTSVLVERVIRHVLDPATPLDLQRLLAVTFTEKAAAEMKQRLRASLEEAFAKSPGDSRIARQMSLLDRAQISTIHAFCLHVVRRYFYKAGLDPSFRVLDENEGELLRQDALSELFEALYQDEGEYGEAFRAVVDRYGGRGVDEGLQATALRLHDFARAQASMDEWLDRAAAGRKSTAREDATRSGGVGQRAGPAPVDEASVWDSPWMRGILSSAARDIARILSFAEEALRVCSEPDGPEGYKKAVLDDISFYRSIAGALRTPSGEESPGERARRLEAVVQAMQSFVFTRLSGRVDKDCDPAKKARVQTLRDDGKKLFGKVMRYAFVRPVADLAGEIAETVPFMGTLVRIVRDLDRRYSEKKLDRGGLDFSDLERYCLGILEREDCQVAGDLRKEFDCVLVDEYQDTNPLQERILSLVSGQPEKTGNRFMVGDLKQSIYRFRLAEPRIFLEKLGTYRKDAADVAEAGEAGQARETVRPDVTYQPEVMAQPEVTAQPEETAGTADGIRIDLSHNFRSRQEVISAVNHVFRRVMKRDVAEIEYGEDHELRMGASYPGTGDDRFCAELHLVERAEPEAKGAETGGEEEGRAEAQQDTGDTAGGVERIEEFEALEKEALVVASRIKALVDPADPLMLWDARAKASRRCSFRDIAILMRSTKDRANAVLEVLSRCDIPAYADTGTGYFQAREVEVALSLLSLIDNPRQDIPLAAVLRSAIAGLEPADLARIRAAHKRGEFHEAVRAFAREGAAAGSSLARLAAPSSTSRIAGQETTGEQVIQRRIASALTKFLDDLDTWRTLARRRPLAEVLWTILRDTGYHDYVGGLPGGGQRQANLRALCDRAREFDSYGRHGLFRFLRFIEKIQDTKGDLGTARALGEHEDVVRVMSVHKAKGLEFPVVFVMDLGKQFNMDDLRQDVLFHRDLGIGGMYCDLEHRIKYPTALHQAISIRIKEENLAEEMRVLYVALTRAKEKLIMVGSARNLPGRLDRWTRIDPAAAITCLDWVCPCSIAIGLAAADSGTPPAAPGQTGSPAPPIQVRLWATPDGEKIPLPGPRTSGDQDLSWRDVRDLKPPVLSHPEVYDEVKRRLEWSYPHRVLTTTFAKMSVGELRRRLEGEEEDFERVGAEPEERFVLPALPPSGGLARGIAVHSLLARMGLDRASTVEVVREEARRLRELGFIEPPGVDEEDIQHVAAFFATPLGKALRSAPQRVRREVPFTMKVPARLFIEAGGPVSGDKPATDASACTDVIVVQGVIDVLMDEAEGLTILDYKTDSVPESALGARFASYLPQVSLYALAAEKILRKPVVKASVVFLRHGRALDAQWRHYMRSLGFAL